MAPLIQELIAAAGVAGRICVGLVFLAAAAQKFSHWRILPAVIANYRLLPHAFVAPASALLPPVELILAVMLLSGFAQGWTVLAAMALLALFAIAMAINLYRGRTMIDCGCGQSFLKQTLNWSLIARNAVLAALLLPSLGAAAVSMPILVAGCGAGLAFALLYLIANTISALPRPA
ncbi:MAG TPA: MauE/DoxX family redox-associated membrane protein [Rhizomicrobium sp.]|nr:MauE/DoxX family redox-associated membrane protein [Rhizomicrobium sp.]